MVISEGLSSPGFSSSLARTDEAADNSRWRLTRELLLSYTQQRRDSEGDPLQNPKCCKAFDGSRKQVDKYNKHRDHIVEEFGKLDELLMADKLTSPLAIYTILCWTGKIRKNIRLLVGKSASPEVLQKITYLCWNHDQRIQQIDTVRAYSCGVEYVAEVDIVLPKEMQLGESHDIGEALQNKLESLPFVERAFVHVDYEVSHKPEHSV
eukprot:c25137_g1_i3 orf=90-713(+)